MARLHKAHWLVIRQTWEADTREGFQWLSEQLASEDIDIGRSAIAKKAARDGWQKTNTRQISSAIQNQNVTPECHAKPENVTQTSRKNVTQNTQRYIPKPEESISEKPEKIRPEAVSQKNENPQTDQKLHGNTKYMPHYDREVYELCLLGYIDKEMAEYFEVTEQTINNWKQWYPNFFESMRAGKARADARVAEALHRRAVGYMTTEIKTEYIADPNNPTKEIVIKRTETTKEVLPDVTACLRILSLRQPELWREQKLEETGEELLPDQIEEWRKMEALMAENKAKQIRILIRRGIYDESDAIDGEVAHE